MFPGMATIFLLISLICFVWCGHPGGARHIEKQTVLTVQSFKSLAGPVSHGGAFSPSDVSWPFPWGSQAAHSASVNTGPSVSFSVTRPLASRLHDRKEDSA